MARRWRIRHKLLLGAITAIAVLGLVLAGTCKGLWSYHVTLKSIKSKLDELDDALEFQKEVADLNLPDTGANPREQISLLEAQANKASDALEQFTRTFQTTVSRDLPDEDGMHTAGLIESLRERLDKLRNACNINDKWVELAPRATDNLLRNERTVIRNMVKALELAALDLRSHIREQLNVRIERSGENFRSTLVVLIVAGVLGIVLLMSGVRFLYGWILTPVSNLQQGVNRVADGDFDHRIRLNSGDEMEELAAAFNDMTGRLQELYKDMARQINDRSRQLVRSERLASVGFLAAGVAHEINNPLASIAFCSEALDARLAELETLLNRVGQGRREFEIFSKYLKMIQEEAFRCKSITERLLEFSRGGEKKRDRIDLAQLIRSVADVMLHHPNSKGKEIVFNSPGPVIAWVNVDEIKSVVLNLVANSLESMDDGGRLYIELSSRDGMAEMTFKDTGCGMSQEVLENIFEPFFTRSRLGKGTGLGLTITHRIINQHGGEIEASSPGSDQGSTFRVRLPLQPAVDTRVTEKEESLGNAAA